MASSRSTARGSDLDPSKELLPAYLDMPRPSTSGSRSTYIDPNQSYTVATKGSR